MKELNDTPESQLSIAILLLPDFTLSAFSLFLDPIRLAADERDGSRQIRATWRVLTLNNLPVKSSCGVEVYPTASRLDHSDIEWLVVVGGLTRTAIHDDYRVLKFIGDAAEDNVRIIGLCTGVFSMAASGILGDETCCVSWFHRDEFVAKYDIQNIDSTRLFHIGNRHITCAGGVGAALVAFEVIRRSLGEDVASKSAKILLMPQSWGYSPEQPMAPFTGVHSEKVRDALHYIEVRIDQKLEMQDVAGSIGVSVRQLERLFKEHLGYAPSRAITLLRTEKGRALLTETEESIIDIALACGYQTPSHFGVAFKDKFGTSPAAYRKKIRQSKDGVSVTPKTHL